MRNIAIIPARSGSKGLKNKNIKELNGKPLLAYTIEAALKSELFEEIMVSTDSEEYGDIARNYGANVPFLRSQKNASDSASSFDMIDEVLENYESKSIVFDSFCLLQPTSPLRNSKDIIKAYQLFEDKEAFSIVSMCELEHPIAWCGELREGLSIDGFIKTDNGNRRQEQKKSYRPNGAIFIADIKEYTTEHNLYRKGGYAYIMPQVRSIDIDTELDFKIAEFLMRENLIEAM